VAILNLLELAERTGDSMWRSGARHALQAFGAVAQTHAEAMRMMAIAVRRYHALAEGEEALVEGGEDPEELAALERTADAPATHKLEDMAASLVTLHLHLDPSDPESEGWRPFRLSIAVEPGWHLQANPASEAFLIPTTVRAEGAELRNVRYPEGSRLESRFSDQPLAVYDGTVEITGEVGQAALDGRLVLAFQACDDARCLPETEREVALLPM
jgi:Disulphide bond corrector protein DsbC